MDLVALESVLRIHVEPLQYAAFFGALVVLGVLEAAWPAWRGTPGRRERWPGNFGLTAMNIVVMGALPISGLVAADWAATRGMGLLQQLGAAAPVTIIVGILARSLVGYAIHVANHRIAWLWRVHRVHHADTGFDVSTTVRFHPLEFAYSAPITVVAIAMLGIPPVAVMIYEVLDAAMAVWTHANVRLPSRPQRAIELVLVTPGMHRIHHSAWQPETDSNYGAVFSIWDRLFRTYRTESQARPAGRTIGLAECQDQRATTLVWLLAMPFASRIEPRPMASKAHASTGGAS